MKSTRSQEINQKNLPKRASLAPRVAKPKPRDEVKERDEKAAAKDTLVRTNGVRKSTAVSKDAAAIPSKLSAAKIAGKPASKTVGGTAKLGSNVSKNGTKHPQTVARQPSDVSLNKRATPRKVTEPTVTKRAVNNTSKNSNKELPLITNVTVNSPVRERKVFEKIDREDEVDANLRVRSKTRTLLDGEAKMLTIDNNVEMNKLIEKVSDTRKALPKSFYIDLSEGNEKRAENKKQTQIKNKVLHISDESNGVNNDVTEDKGEAFRDETEDCESYEDDFESYESDFESYKSESSSVDACSVSSASAEKSTNDEKMLDSGSFELRDGSHRAVTAGVGVMEEIEEGVGGAGAYEEGDGGSRKKEGQQQSSLTDEGFIEMVSSAPPAKKVPVEKRSGNFFDLLKSRATSRRNREAEARQRRAADLTSMITLDRVTFSLHEMRPLAYDAFMSLYGRGASHAQATTQTNVDSETRGTQTEDVFRNTMWTQCPLEFSKQDIWAADGPNGSKNEDGNRILEESIESILGIRIEKETEIKDEDGSQWMKVDSVKEIYSKYLDFDIKSSHNEFNSDWKDVDPLIVYVEQKNGCGMSERIRKNEYERMLKRSRDYDVDRLNRFLNKVSKRVIAALGRSKMTDGDGWKVKKDKEWQFSDGYKVAIEEDEEDSVWKLRSLVVSETDDRVIVTLHELSGEEVDGRGRMCVWNVEDDGRWEVRNVLSCAEGVRECGVVGSGNVGRGLVVVAGLEDGSVCAWEVGSRTETRPLRSSASLEAPDAWCGRIVGLVTEARAPEAAAPYLQWHVLHEYGALRMCRLARRDVGLRLVATHRLDSRAPRTASRTEDDGSVCTWESGLICYAVRRAPRDDSLLIACNGGRVTEFTTGGVLRVYRIQEPWFTLHDVAPHYAHSARWYAACGAAGGSPRVTLARGPRALRTLAGRSAPGVGARDETRVWWSQSGGTVLLTSGGALSVWELTRGDLDGAGGDVETNAAVRSLAGVGEALGVVYESGRVELHRVVRNAAESRLLRAYLQLL